MSAAYLQYVLGLKDLGHEVLYYEDSDNYPSCYDPDTFEMTTEPKYGLKYINQLFESFDMKDEWCYYDDHTGNWYGKSKQNQGTKDPGTQWLGNLHTLPIPQGRLLLQPCSVVSEKLQSYAFHTSVL